LEGLFVSICIRAAQAMIGVGASIILRGSGAHRHSGSVVQAFFDCTGGLGGHGTLTGEMVPIGVGRRMPSMETKSDSASRPMLYRNCVAGGWKCCRYQALSKIA
jgi:hypothetical protein